MSFRRNRTRLAAALLATLAGCRNPNVSADQRSLTTTAAVVTGAPPPSYADVVDRVAPAVVTIRSARRLRAPQQFPFYNDPFFRQLFGNRYNQPPQEAPLTERSLGSGVIVNSDGHLVTNHHVVDGADEITVELNDRRTLQAKLIGSDAPSDIAVLKISASNLPVLPFADSDKVRVGDLCLAVGNPLGLGQTVTAGIISAKGRSTGLSDGAFEDFLQTDAAINRGNSGGPLVNLRGEMAGVNSQIISPSGGSIGIGFAIPSNMARVVTEQLTKNGKVSRGMLGITIQPITSELAAAMNLKEVRGALVNSVQAGSPAERAGLKPGDVITAVDGSRVNDPNTLRNRIATTPPATEVILTILRDGREQSIRARVGELPANRENSTQQGSTGPAQGQLGLSVQPLTDQLAAQRGLPRGTRGLLVVEVDPNGPAESAGIQPDDVILQVNRQPVQSVADFKSALHNSKTPTNLLLVNRGGRNVFVAIPSAAGG